MPDTSTGERLRIVVAGGGAAGFFAAIACAEANPRAEVTLHEATMHPLAKVRVSGGGRCNVTHASFDAREMAKNYPRGSRELIGPLSRFGPADTVAWFGDRGVATKTEKDGRMFPVTDDSATIVNCLMGAASKAGARLITHSGIRSVEKIPDDPKGRFTVTLTTGDAIQADRVLIATGGVRGSVGHVIAEKLGHSITPQVPSLFTFHVNDPRINGLEGICALATETSVRGTRLAASGPVLVTHWGLSGPGILKLSAWGARELSDLGYTFTLAINWAAPRSVDQVRSDLEAQKAAHPKRQISNSAQFGLPSRLWERLVVASGIAGDATWVNVSKDSIRALSLQLTASEFAVTGKSMNKEEFVTCGGVCLAEVDMATMESRICPGLYFAGEVLDIDGITGGYNFQAAWTTGWQAGNAMARAVAD
jgi:predicted Rossmann fold flavoprotein